MNEQEQFSFAFNSGILMMMQLLKEMEGDKLKAAILAAEITAGEAVEKAAGMPAEDVLLKIDPFVASIKKRIIEA